MGDRWIERAWNNLRRKTVQPEIVPRSFGTHDGSFHADEVTACALLLLVDLIDRDKVIRTRKMTKLRTCEYVCDVGGIYDPTTKRFDHHQSSYEGKLSSAGMVLKYLKDNHVMSQELYRHFHHSLVRGVDAIDNGMMPAHFGFCTFSMVIGNFVPAQHDVGPSVLYQSFLQAVSFAHGHLTRLKEKMLVVQQYRNAVKEEMAKYQKVLIFDRSMPWLESFFELGGKHHPAQFIIMPSENKWKLRAIPPTYDRRMEVRMPLPPSWAGLIGEELQEKTQVKGAIFCHKGQFLSIWRTKEDALQALQLVWKGVP